MDSSWTKKPANVLLLRPATKHATQASNRTESLVSVNPYWLCPKSVPKAKPNQSAPSTTLHWLMALVDASWQSMCASSSSSVPTGRTGALRLASVICGPTAAQHLHVKRRRTSRTSWHVNVSRRKRTLKRKRKSTKKKNSELVATFFLCSNNSNKRINSSYLI